MSSEALERAEALLAVEASSVRAPSWWFAAARSAARDVLALLAEVARLEQDRDEAKDQRDNFERIARERAENAHVNWQARGAAEAALAVAREREQRLRGALQQVANHNVRAPVTGTSADDPCDWHCTAQQRDLARAALVDEPAAACTCWPDEANAMCPLHGMDAPAAATLAEPEGSVEEAHHGATVEARVATPPGSASAAADEPGETPA